jgi:hypothetical protein
VKFDSVNVIALSNAAAAYREKNNFEKYVEFTKRVMAVDPLNTLSIEAIIDDLVSKRHSELAIPLVEERVKALPGDVHWLQKKPCSSRRSSTRPPFNSAIRRLRPTRRR